MTKHIVHVINHLYVCMYVKHRRRTVQLFTASHRKQVSFW